MAMAGMETLARMLCRKGFRTRTQTRTPIRASLKTVAQMGIRGLRSEVAIPLIVTSGPIAATTSTQIWAPDTAGLVMPPPRARNETGAGRRGARAEGAGAN